MTDLPNAWTDPNNDPFEGLPAWMVNERPHTVLVKSRSAVGRGVDARTGRPIIFKHNGFDGAYTLEEHVQLERDGKELTLEDRLPTWRAGERDGWLKR